MKNLIFAALLCVSVSAFAAETNSMRTPGGDLVQIGTSEDELFQRMGKAKPKFYVLDDGRRYCAATEYSYEIGMERYMVILCRGHVVKIQWERR